MAHWDEDLEQGLRDALAVSRDRHGRELTGAAVDFLRLCLTSIDGEPPPRCAGEARNLRDAQRLAIRMVPTMLATLSRSGEGPIGVFQLLEEAPRLMGMYFAFAYPP